MMVRARVNVDGPSYADMLNQAIMTFAISSIFGQSESLKAALCAELVDLLRITFMCNNMDTDTGNLQSLEGTNYDGRVDPPLHPLSSSG
jgi:hypothetical protein